MEHLKRHRLSITEADVDDGGREPTTTLSDNRHTLGQERPEDRQGGTTSLTPNRPTPDPPEGRSAAGVVFD